MKLARLRDWRCKNPEATIAETLVGNWREEHLLALQQAFEAWKLVQLQIARPRPLTNTIR